MVGKNKFECFCALLLWKRWKSQLRNFGFDRMFVSRRQNYISVLIVSEGNIFASSKALKLIIFQRFWKLYRINYIAMHFEAIAKFSQGNAMLLKENATIFETVFQWFLVPWVTLNVYDWKKIYKVQGKTIFQCFYEPLKSFSGKRNTFAREGKSFASKLKSIEINHISINHITLKNVSLGNAILLRTNSKSI